MLADKELAPCGPAYPSHDAVESQFEIGAPWPAPELGGEKVCISITVAFCFGF